METWALAAVLVIIASILLSAWRKIYFTAVVSVTCVVVYAMQQWVYPKDWFSFHSHDLIDPSYLYTVLTSIYSHSPLDVYHLFFNILFLALIGFVFEQRIGTRPFIALYLISGLFGTLAFAAWYWNDTSYSVLGASGAISGVLGGYARLYPDDRMQIIFLPGINLRAAYVVAIVVVMQLFVATNTNVAWMSHLAGLAAGIAFAPLVVKLRTETPVRRSISTVALRKLAVTPELQGILRRVESEEVPDVRRAWMAHFISRARCPVCGGQIKISGDSIRCSRGHIL